MRGTRKWIPPSPSISKALVNCIISVSLNGFEFNFIYERFAIMRHLKYAALKS